MAKEKLLLLLNPKAGRSEVKSRLLDVIDRFVKANYNVRVVTTQRPREMSKIIAKKGSKYKMIVCVGGDGTVNEVINGVMRCAQKPIIGVIPTGTINDFATSLQIPKNVNQAVDIILEGHPFACDIGSFNNSYFSYVAAFGPFAGIAYNTSQQNKNLIGRFAYFFEGIRSVFPKIDTYRAGVEYDGGIIEGDFILGMVSNSTSIGGFRLMPQSDVALDDGVMEVSLVKNPRNPIELQEIINALVMQESNPRALYPESVYVFKTNRVRFLGEEELPWTLDGENGGMISEAVVETIPRAVTFMVPPGFVGGAVSGAENLQE